GLDTRTPAGKAMFQIMGVFAEFERTIIQERVRAGLARAKSEGKRLGRPRIAPALEERIRKALAIPGRPFITINAWTAVAKNENGWRALSARGTITRSGLVNLY